MYKYYASSLYEIYIIFVFSYIFKCRYGDGLLTRPSYRLEPQVFLFLAVEHRALEVLRPRPPGEAISIHHDWVDRYVMNIIVYHLCIRRYSFVSTILFIAGYVRPVY